MAFPSEHPSPPEWAVNQEKAHQYRNIERFNQLWSEKLIVTPLVIMVGGYAGTGKSTLVEYLKKHVNYLSSFATGFARAAAQTFITREQNPALYESTFKLHELCDDPNEKTQIWKRFIEQRTPIENVLSSCGMFIAGEHQNTVIDGNHVSPSLASKIAAQCDVIPIDIYLKVTNPSTHFTMMCGPTHSRTLSEQDFNTARILHDGIILEAELYCKPIFEWTDSIDGTLSVIDESLASIVAQF